MWPPWQANGCYSQILQPEMRSEVDHSMSDYVQGHTHTHTPRHGVEAAGSVYGLSGASEDNLVTLELGPSQIYRQLPFTLCVWLVYDWPGRQVWAAASHTQLQMNPSPVHDLVRQCMREYVYVYVSV